MGKGKGGEGGHKWVLKEGRSKQNSLFDFYKIMGYESSETVAY